MDSPAPALRGRAATPAGGVTQPPAPGPPGEHWEGIAAVLPWRQSLLPPKAGAANEPAVPVMVPVAWLGRTSTEDAQDPTISLPRQLSNSRDALPDGFVIVAHFYDVESGRKDLSDRGRGHAHERFAIPVPRDGGIADLLAEAARPDRRFVAVVCESIERVARRTYFGTKVEYELEQCGVALLAADEPLPAGAVTGQRRGGRSAKRATPILTRRVKQAIAEWYALQMLELSWDGFCTHTEQGWNIGKPCYGYLADKIPHPVPAKRAEGRTKTRLRPDPVRGPVVTRIFHHRVLDRLGYDYPPALVRDLRAVRPPHVRQDPPRPGLLRLRTRPAPPRPAGRLVSRAPVQPVGPRRRPARHRARLLRRAHLRSPPPHLLAAQLASRAAPQPGRNDNPERQKQLQQAISDIERRKRTLVTELESQPVTGDPGAGREYREAIQRRFTELVAEHRAKAAELARLTERPAEPATGDPDLLQALPQIPLLLADLPEPLQRSLYDAFQLQVRYRRPRHEVTIRATIRAETLDSISQAVSQITKNEKKPGNRSHVLGAPSRIRTCAPASGGRCSIP
jgi:hypothetical protein